MKESSRKDAKAQSKEAKKQRSKEERTPSVEVVDDTLDAVLDQRDIEVDQQAKPLAGQAEVREQLLAVYGVKRINGLQLRNYEIRDHQVGFETDIQVHGFVDHPNGNFFFDSKPALLQLIPHHIPVDRFKQTRSQSRMHLERCIHNDLGYFVLVHVHSPCLLCFLALRLCVFA
jgi:hypothetical protein